ncbi:MAG: metallophosphoesterase [Defluviitaleaceae bacterium]|nr:metallophosphoesterase [Defluviitaleaceae bacterium]
MNILIVSDKENRTLWKHFDRTQFEGVKMVISAGDIKQYYLEHLAAMLPVPLLYVPGNHDTYMAENKPKGCYPVDGKIASVNGIKIAGLGGCQSRNPDGVFQLSEQQMAARVKKLMHEAGNHIDIFVSHAPALGLGDGGDFFHKGFACFHEILDDAKPKLHIFGHQHLSYAGKQEYPIQYKDTLLYNAFGHRVIEIDMEGGQK